MYHENVLEKLYKPPCWSSRCHNEVQWISVQRKSISNGKILPEGKNKSCTENVKYWKAKKFQERKQNNIITYPSMREKGQICVVKSL